MPEQTTVGKLREQSALADAKTPVIVSITQHRLLALLGGLKLKVVNVYPDTMDDAGTWGGVFKVELELE